MARNALVCDLPKMIFSCIRYRAVSMKATGRIQSVRVSSEPTRPHRGRSTDRSTGEQHLPVDRPDRPAGRARKGGAAPRSQVRHPARRQVDPGGVGAGLGDWWGWALGGRASRTRPGRVPALCRQLNVLLTTIFQFHRRSSIDKIILSNRLSIEFSVSSIIVDADPGGQK